MGQKGFNFGVKHCVIIEPVLKAFEGITNHRQRRQQQLQRPQLQQRQLLLLGIYTVNELNPRVFLFILFSDINQIFKSNSGEYDTEFSQQSKHNLEAPINQIFGSGRIIYSLVGVLMITKSNSMIFEPISDELIELDLNSNDYNPHGACAVYFKNQIVMIGGSQNGARVAIVKDCEFQILAFKLPYEVEYHSCAVRYPLRPMSHIQINLSIRFYIREP